MANLQSTFSRHGIPISPDVHEYKRATSGVATPIQLPLLSMQPSHTLEHSHPSQSIVHGETKQLLGRSWSIDIGSNNSRFCCLFPLTRVDRWIQNLWDLWRDATSSLCRRKNSLEPGTSQNGLSCWHGSLILKPLRSTLLPPLLLQVTFRDNSIHILARNPLTLFSFHPSSHYRKFDQILLDDFAMGPNQEFSLISLEGLIVLSIPLLSLDEPVDQMIFRRVTGWHRLPRNPDIDHIERT